MALINVSTVDIKAAVSAAIINPNIPGLVTILATTTNISSGLVFGLTIPGSITDMAFPSQPAAPVIKNFFSKSVNLSRCLPLN